VIPELTLKPPLLFFTKPVTEEDRQLLETVATAPEWATVYRLLCDLCSTPDQMVATLRADGFMGDRRPLIVYFHENQISVIEELLQGFLDQMYL
jgi:hypothetical protein